MPIFSNITNLPTYPLDRNSNPLLQNELPWNCSSAKQQNIPPGSSPIDYTIQYPTHPNTPRQPIQGCSIAPPPFPTLLTRGIPTTGPYHVDSDEENPNDIRYSPAVPSTNLTCHGDFAEDVITQSDLDIGDFEYAWRELSRIQSPSSTTPRHTSSSNPPSKWKRLGRWTPPSQPEHLAPWSVPPKRNPFKFPPPSQPPPPVIKTKDDTHIRMHQPAGATSIGQQTPYPAQHAEPIIIRFGTITALATLAIPLSSAPPPAYFISTPNTTTQPIAPEYAGYTNMILHHLENLTMSYKWNPETSLPIGKYIRQIEAQQLTQKTTITNLMTSLRATREAVQNQAEWFRQVLDAGRHLEEQLD
ncbi:hypothetical protein AX16_010465 [Volvariella volvacea WC 439]|nr:hypothetical protein AX16_010465 [Volvariella volvacea WC 439]